MTREVDGLVALKVKRNNSHITAASGFRQRERCENPWGIPSSRGADIYPASGVHATPDPLGLGLRGLSEMAVWTHTEVDRADSR